MSEAAKILEQLGGVHVSKSKAPFLHKKAERLAARAGIQKPLLYVIPDSAPNACAVGLSDEDTAVAVTTGLLAKLDESQIEAVLAHEIGHIQKGHSVAKTRVALKAMAISFAAGTAGRMVLTSDLDFTPGDGDSDDFASLALKILGQTILQSAGNAIASNVLTSASFESEFEADECGGAFSRKPWALASALKRIEKLTMEGEKEYEPEVSQLFIVSPAYLQHQTHPATLQRIERLVAMKSHMSEVVSLPTMFCSSCGEKTDTDGVYCYWCGVELGS